VLGLPKLGAKQLRWVLLTFALPSLHFAFQLLAWDIHSVHCDRESVTDGFLFPMNVLISPLLNFSALDSLI